MKNYPLVSVVITNYNYAQYITKAIESVLSQTYRNIELIIINDGSTDNSDEIIKQAISANPGRNIRYVNRENKGVVHTRNEGIEIAKGEYISYLDADDYFNRNYISRSYKIAKDYDADIVYPNWHFVGDWLGRPDTNFPEFTPRLLQLQKLHCTPASLIKKEAIKSHRFEVEKVAEDWDFFIGLSLDGVKFKLAKDNFINYRIRQGTRGSRNDPKEDTSNFIDILTKYKNMYGDEVIDPKRLARLRHPSVVIRVLRMRYPRAVVASIKEDGTRIAARKILRKLLSHNKIVWKVLGDVRNASYSKITESLNLKTSPDAKLAVVLHLYYPSLWPVISKKLAHINVPFDLFVSVQEKDKELVLSRVSKYHKVTNITSFPNRGRDVLPFLLLLEKIIQHDQYKYILKIHSKKSLHRKDGSEWLDSLLSELIPSDVSKILKTLKNPGTGAIGPANHVVSLSRYMGDNRQRIATIIEPLADCKTISRILGASNKYPFFGGTMFWCRLDFLTPLLKTDLSPARFDTERGQVDGTTAHALERIFGKILHELAHKKMYIVRKSVVSELPEKAYTAKYKHVG